MVCLSSRAPGRYCWMDRCLFYPRKRTSEREVRHASFDGAGLVSSHGASERTEIVRRTQMAKLVDVWIFDLDKYSPDDLVQKDDIFQLGLALLPALVKRGRTTTCGARARLRRPRSARSGRA